MQSKPIQCFSIGNDKNGKDYRCKECRKENYAKSIGKSKNQIGIKGKIVNGKKLCTKCKQYKIASCFSVYATHHRNGLASACKTCANWSQRIRNKIRMMEFVLAYGGKCQCCGEARIEILTIEHIKGKGHKLIYDSAPALIRKLKVLNWPEGYTVLCWNCNLTTKFGEPCVHSKEYEVYKREFDLALESNTNREKYQELKYELETMNIKTPIFTKYLKGAMKRK